MKRKGKEKGKEMKEVTRKKHTQNDEKSQVKVGRRRDKEKEEIRRRKNIRRREKHREGER